MKSQHKVTGGVGLWEWARDGVFDGGVREVVTGLRIGRLRISQEENHAIRKTR